MRPTISRSSVDLPHPLGPISARQRSAGTCSVVGSSAAFPSYCLRTCSREIILFMICLYGQRAPPPGRGRAAGIMSMLPPPFSATELIDAVRDARERTFDLVNDLTDA